MAITISRDPPWLAFLASHRYATRGVVVGVGAGHAPRMDRAIKMTAAATVPSSRFLSHDLDSACRGICDGLLRKHAFPARRVRSTAAAGRWPGVSAGARAVAAGGPLSIFRRDLALQIEDLSLGAPQLVESSPERVADHGFVSFRGRFHHL